MDKVLIKESTLTAIGDAVRAKTGVSGMLSVEAMAEALGGIKSSGKYLFSKKETESSDILGYAVSDDLEKYPDGGTQDGYYWECVGGKPGPKIVSWADGTDEEIVAMVEAADRGEINLADYWSVGDERSVDVSAISWTSSSNVTTTFNAQTVKLVLMHEGEYELNATTPSGRSTCSFIVGMKDTMQPANVWNLSGNSAGSWEGSQVRDWCNNAFYNALPSVFKTIFKQFKTKTASEYNATTLTTSIDYFAFPALKEITGTGMSIGSLTSDASMANSVESNALFQFEYYKTGSNWVKESSGTSQSWWTRSPAKNPQAVVCCIGMFDATTPYSTGMSASQIAGYSPFGCI